MADTPAITTVFPWRIAYDTSLEAYFWKVITETKAVSQWSSKSSMYSAITAALPEDLMSTWLIDSYAGSVILTLAAAFSSGKGPAWFSAMPDDAQTFMVSTVLPLKAQDLHDWGGTSSTTYHGITTTYDPSLRLIRLQTELAISAVASYISELLAGAPSSIGEFSKTWLPVDGGDYSGRLAGSIFTDLVFSGNYEYWFELLPLEVKRFALLAFLPDKLPESLLGQIPVYLVTVSIVSNAVTSTAASPGASVAMVPSPTRTLSSDTLPIRTVTSDTPSPTIVNASPQRLTSTISLAIALGTALPLLFLLVLIGALMYWRRRKRARARGKDDTGAGTLHTGRRWSGSVFSTVSDTPARHETVPEMPPTLPEIPRSLTPGVAVAEMKPKIDHDAKPAADVAESSELADKAAAELVEEPRPASAMSIRQVQQEDLETPKRKRKSWRLSKG
ncbi:hypothetical protein B0A48_03578 [Cryoendolithus antarcticus]|uniref:Uncharacterized protein n=1 Tax=Cryoendolithus antarcticus TaxID=1507870 RepID=A0A1V8TKS2_9PEZI|nr:hypothetical protein B0A48_03578 [Cryoendolithus antarcticus]